jgi:hypothetical protein
VSCCSAAALQDRAVAPMQTVAGIHLQVSSDAIEMRSEKIQVLNGATLEKFQHRKISENTVVLGTSSAKPVDTTDIPMGKVGSFSGRVTSLHVDACIGFDVQSRRLESGVFHATIFLLLNLLYMAV